MAWRVRWSRAVDKQLRRTPGFIQEKFRAWAAAVEADGMFSVRKLKGFHDEPLSGPRRGQRSVRLNVAYRAIYVEYPEGQLEVVEVLEVTKHDYR